MNATTESIKTLQEAAECGGWDFESNMFREDAEWETEDIEHAKERTAFALATLCYLEGRRASGTAQRRLRKKRFEFAQTCGKRAINLSNENSITGAVARYYYSLTLIALANKMDTVIDSPTGTSIVRIAERAIKADEKAIDVLNTNDCGLRGKTTVADCRSNMARAYVLLALHGDEVHRTNNSAQALDNLETSIELTTKYLGPLHPDSIRRKQRLNELRETEMAHGTGAEVN